MHFTDSLEFGGAEQVALAVLSGLDRRRWKPLLLHRRREPGLAALVRAAGTLGVEARQVPPIRTRSEAWRGLPGFYRAVRQARPDVFHAHLTTPLGCKYGLLAAAAAGVPAIVGTVHLIPEIGTGIRYAVSQRMITACVRCYIAVSRGVADGLLNRLGVPPAKLRVVPNGIPVARFEAPGGADRAPTPVRRASRPLVLTVARLDQQKGHDCLLEAARLVPEADFALAGEGHRRAVLEGMARALGVEERVRFLGFRSDVPDLLAACDVFVLPSLHEGLPLAVLEAMAAARPVVGTAIAGTDEAIVHGVTGLLVPPSDPAALAGAIRMLLGSPDLSRRLALEGRARVRREFTVEAMVAGVEALYDELLGGDGSRAGARS